MAIRYCLDTNTAIYFLSGRLSEPLPEGEWLISVITELELRSYTFATPDDERKVAEFIERIPVVALTPEIKRLAITMRRDKRLKLPDAIIAATSQITQATLVTNDDRLDQALGVSCVVPSLKT
ncbi:MAG: type II toxin-antitoxin system VapC family toxin [Betaproteobacteria bacterium]|nr:type II toxin-antitoxin system VapC family toxin [Betaproteobacteria bacterium]